jgi:uncharacterized protein
MPLYCIHAFDKPGTSSLRAEHYPAHLTYLAGAAGAGVIIHASGPLVAEDGVTAIGSLFVLEASDQGAAERFNAGDPFALANLWAQVAISRFSLRRGSVGAAVPPPA